MAHNAPGKEKRIKSACTLPGILTAGVILTSVDIFPQDGWLAWLPPGIARFLVVLYCFYGGISIFKDLTLYFMSGSREEK
ncbi:hypothetical protein Q9R34_05085 [Enterobacter sp. BRE11]|nr:hypothetical protein [Enterobacter sp. BRE11]